jgi:GTP-binding protein
VRIKDVKYIGSYASSQALPKALGPEIVFVGRSNVGKSTLINVLVGRRNVARTSGTPGKTRTANLYSVNEAFCFVDVPGYGYAKVSKSERGRWRRLIAGYLTNRDSLAGVVQLLDIRHKPSAEDQRISQMLHEIGRPVCFVFNKTDKVKKQEIDSHIVSHLGTLTTDAKDAVVAFSAETGAGKRGIWAWIEDVLSL